MPVHHIYTQICWSVVSYHSTSIVCVLCLLTNWIWFAQAPHTKCQHINERFSWQMIPLSIVTLRVSASFSRTKKTTRTGSVCRQTICLGCEITHFSQVCMMTSSNGNIFRGTGPLWGGSTVHRWIPLTKANGAGLWYFLWCGLNGTVWVHSIILWYTLNFRSGAFVVCFGIWEIHWGDGAAIHDLQKHYGHVSWT